MLVTGLTAEQIETEGVRSFALQDVLLQATPAELRKLAAFLETTASKLELPAFETQSEEFADSGPSPLVGISFMVLAEPGVPSNNSFKPKPLRGSA